MSQSSDSLSSLGSERERGTVPFPTSSDHDSPTSPASQPMPSPAVPSTAEALSSNPLNTRLDLLHSLQALLTPLDAHVSPGGARVTVGHTAAHFDDTAAQLEGYARRLWGAVPAAIGFPDGSDQLDWATFSDGLACGVDPDDEEYWGHPIDGDQRLVEAAAIGFALAFAPERMWDKRTTPLTKMHVQHWLLSINDLKIPNNNWLFFRGSSALLARVLVNLGLARVNCQHSIRGVKEALETIEEWYIGDGWYSDGPTQQRDYYISFAMHYYSLIYCHIASTPFFANSRLVSAEKVKTYKERASLFAKDFIHYFDPESGASIPFGRSLTYRFACASFWGALAFADVELPKGLTWGIVKSTYLKNLRWWFARPEILNNDGTLTIGYGYPNLNMAEAYNSPGSPYWALKCFLPLSLPETHPFWSSDESSHPDPLSSPHIIPAAHSIIIHSRRTPSHTYALTSGQFARFFSMRHTESKYGKLSYSATFGFCVPTGSDGLHHLGSDCTLALSDDANVTTGNGDHWRVRKIPLDSAIVRGAAEGEVAVYARWDAWQDVEVQTWVAPISRPPNSEWAEGDWHIRIHRIKTARQIKTCDGGFSVHGQSSRAPHRRLSSWDHDLDEGTEVHPHESVIRSRVGTTGVRFVASSMEEFSGLQATGLTVQCAPNSSILFPHSLLPSLGCTLEPRPEPYLIAVAVFALTGQSLDDGWRRAWDAGRSIEVPKWLSEEYLK